MDWLNKLLNKNNKRIGLQLEGETLSYCYLLPQTNTPEISAASQIQLSEDSLTVSFKAAIAEINAKGADAYWILPSESYRLLTVERPSVPDSEMTEAIRWQIKDQIDVPLEEAVITHFEYPDNLPGGKRQFVVVARLDAVQRLIDLSLQSDLNLKAIDIQELSLGNLMTPWLQQGQNIALIAETPTGISVNCFNGNEFSFNRALPGVFLPRSNDPVNSEPETSDSTDNENTNGDEEFSLDVDIGQHETDDTNNDQLLLEIQRTLDYYESQISRQAVTKVILPDFGQKTESLAEELNANLGLQVDILKLNKHFNWSDSLVEHQLSRHLPVCGGAYRDMEVAHATD
ncbi:hypothetical protein [Pleionea mediterranea]|uniref:Tfp pilus assembly PilM family ATPase n=1 Tax=Pleionea mediterranea TaxID=523701 RepID=A0A316FW63_9GAMM|nr:hypothetical protein [Pleionea mediterranea]PWK52941.1 Tfp pilus assembly PilM family ATPase [Pleionea mediterranea]